MTIILLTPNLWIEYHEVYATLNGSGTVSGNIALDRPGHFVGLSATQDRYGPNNQIMGIMSLNETGGTSPDLKFGTFVSSLSFRVAGKDISDSNDNWDSLGSATTLTFTVMVWLKK